MSTKLIIETLLQCGCGHSWPVPEYVYKIGPFVKRKGNVIVCNKCESAREINIAGYKTKNGEVKP